jgi:hypothetical protein
MGRVCVRMTDKQAEPFLHLLYARERGLSVAAPMRAHEEVGAPVERDDHVWRTRAARAQTQAVRRQQRSLLPPAQQALHAAAHDACARCRHGVECCVASAVWWVGTVYAL